MLRYLKSYLGVILFTLLLAIIMSNFISGNAISIISGIGNSIKSIVVAIVPLVIFCISLNSGVSNGSGSLKVLFIALIALILSSSVAFIFSGSIAYFIKDFLQINSNAQVGEIIIPREFFQFKSIISIQFAMFFGLFGGILLNILSKKVLKLSTYITTIQSRCVFISNIILKGILCLVPIFVFGFVLKMSYEGVIMDIARQSLLLILAIFITLILYFLLMCIITVRFDIHKIPGLISNAIPAIITAFSTMSSAATMPLTINACQSRMKNKNLPNIILPVTTNIHLIGDSIGVPFLIAICLVAFAIPYPDIQSMLSLLFLFVFCHFSVVAIPAGGIIALLPVLQSNLNFTPDAIGLITALYILFDPILTVGNVIGNYLLTINLDRDD